MQAYMFQEPNGWLVVDEITGKETKVFCKVDANTPEDAIGIVQDLSLSVPETLSEMKNLLTQRLSQSLDAMGEELLRGIPTSERFSFYAKELEARAFLLGGEMELPVTSILREESTALGDSLEEVARRIVDRADLFRRAAGIVSGYRQAGRRAIESSSTIEEANLTYTSVLSEAKGKLIVLPT